MKLLECPFCGGAAEFERLGDPGQSCIVACTECGVTHESGDEGFGNGRSWNSRAILSASAGEKKDAERLDWLDQQGVAYGFEHVLEGYRWELDGPFNTARDAIDAYMSASKSNQEQSTNKDGE